MLPNPMKRRTYALDMARGLAYLHNCKPPIIHRFIFLWLIFTQFRDIKSLNILLDDKAEHAKICDVGLARVGDCTSSAIMTNAVGTFCWMPPEMMARCSLHKIGNFLER